MAKNVELMGAVFPDCPAVLLPTHEGPLARFTDVSDSQAVAADVAQGKQFYLADGTKTTGPNPDRRQVDRELKVMRFSFPVYPGDGRTAFHPHRRK